MQTQQKKSKRFINLCKKYGVNPDNVPEVMDFKSACKITGDDPSKLNALITFVKNLAKRHQKYMVAAYMLPIIAEALKGNKRPDFTNSSEYKRFAIFEVKADKERPSGFGLSYRDYDFWSTLSLVGVRLSFVNYDIVKFFGMHFIKLHKDFHLYT